VRNKSKECIKNFTLVDILPKGQCEEVKGITSNGIFDGKKITWKYSKPLKMCEKKCF